MKISQKKTSKGVQIRKPAHIGSYDILGDIAIIEVPPNLKARQHEIAKSILSLHKNIKTVLKKAGSHEGDFRTQKMAFLAGKRNKITIHKEHNCLIKLDVEKIYFSPRLSNERKRIFMQVQPGEKILVMFSGSGVYPITISKNSKAAEIIGAELNPVAHKYALENVKLNRLKNVKLFLGDAGKAAGSMDKQFDRILMPYPKGGPDFLDSAVGVAKKGSIIHLYDFFPEYESEKPLSTFAKIEKACSKAKKKFKILSWVKCGQVGPRNFRICVDFRIL